MEKIYYVKGSQPRTGKNIFIIFFSFTALSFLVFFLINIFLNQSSPQIYKKVKSQIDILIPPEDKLLKQVVQNELKESKGSYGVAIKNLKTGENYYFNEHNRYNSASLYKLWVMAETFAQIKNGRLKEDDTLSEDAEMLNDKFNIASESAEFTEGAITLSVNNALNKMIGISDNYAALLLAAKIRLSNIASFLRLNGFNESTVGSNGDAPATTAHDVLLFFEKLYNAQLINEKYSTLMLELLKTQKLNNKMPKYLPQDTVIAHKTGELDKYNHDGGIVYGANGDYIIVILTKTNASDLAANRISNISEAVFNYFENN